MSTDCHAMLFQLLLLLCEDGLHFTLRLSLKRLLLQMTFSFNSIKMLFACNYNFWVCISLLTKRTGRNENNATKCIMSLAHL